MRQFAKRGLILIVILFLTELAILLIVSSLPYFPGEESVYIQQAQQLNSTTQNATTPQLATEIFTNNYRIALAEMIPILGVFLFTFSLYATARVAEADAYLEHVPVVAVILVLFIVPDTWIELPAYAVATAESLYLLYAIIKRLRGRQVNFGAEAWQLGINLIIITVMLAVAAVFEALAINLKFYFWVMWIPFLGVLLMVLALNRRLTKIRREEVARAATVGLEKRE